MSLLMDALRRAEADKKAQEERAARAAGSEAATNAGPPTRVSTYSNAKDDTVQIDGRALQAAASIADFDLRIDDDLDRSFSMTQPEGLSLEPLSSPTTPGDNTNFDVINQPLNNDDAKFPGNLTFAGRIDRRDRTTTLTPPPVFEDDDDDEYFDRDYSTPNVRNVPPVDDGTLEQVSAHTVASAQTVFRAGERTRSGRLLTLAAAIATPGSPLRFRPPASG